MSDRRAGAPSTSIETLACGLRLVTEAMSEVHSVAIGFWVGSGSRDEPERVAGASHFLEHLLFKGTPELSAAEIAEALDEVGGDCNAYTTKEYTTFFVRLLAEHLPLGLDILSRIMWDPALRPEDLESERAVIQDEIRMHADEPADLVVERCLAALFPGHPLGRDALGTAGSVGAITTDDVRGFFEQHYRPKNMVVSVAGRLGHDEVAAAVQERFAGRPGGGPPARHPPTDPSEPVVVVARPTEQAHLALGMRCISRSDDDRWAFSVLNQVLGGGMSSRLFQKVREQRGLAYSIGSERLAFEDTGSLCVVAGTAPERAEEVLSIVAGELGALAAEGVSERELAVAKGNLRAEVLLAIEDSGARMSRVGSALLLHGEVKSVEEVLSLIESVSREDVRRAAQRLAAEPRTLAVVGPFGQGDFDRVVSGLAAHLS